MSGLPIPNDYNPETDGQRLVMLCIPDSVMWRSIIRGSIYRLTRGREWDGATGTITEAQAVAWEIWETMNMNCLDVFASLDDTLREIAAAIRDIRLIDGCGGGCGDTPDPPPHDGTPPPFGEGEEYEDQAEYDQARCSAANAIVDSLTGYFTKYALLDIDSIVLGGANAMFGVVVAVILANPIGLTLAAIIGAIAAIVSFLLGDAVVEFSDVKDVLVLKKDDLVCALYNAPDTETAREAFMAILTDELLTLPEETIVRLHLYNAVLNLLFEPDEATKNYAGTVDCSDCGCGDTYQVWRTGDRDAVAVVGQADGQDIVISSSDAEEHNGYHVVRAGLYLADPFSSPDCPLLDHQIEFVSISNNIADLTGGNITAANTDKLWTWAAGGAGLIGVTFNVMFVYLSQLEPFSITVRVNPVPAPEPLPSNALSIDFDEGDFSEFDSNTTDTSGGHVISVDPEAEI